MKEQQIPEAIKQKIEERYPQSYFSGAVELDDFQFSMKRKAAEYGYSIAQELLTEKEKEIEKIGNESMIFEMDLRNAKLEIERLKGLIEKAYLEGRNYHNYVGDGVTWQQFKAENNL